MRFNRVTPDPKDPSRWRRHEGDGTFTEVELFVGQDDVPRLVTREQREHMEGVGEYTGARGYDVLVTGDRREFAGR